MNTPDGHDEQGAGTQAKPVARPLLRTTTWSGHRPGAFERVLFKVSAALRPLIAAHLTEEHSFLFAEPVTDPDTGEVHWYSPIEGDAVAYVDLVREDQAAVDTRVNRLLFDLLELARKLRAEPKTLEDYIMGQLLELQLDASYSQKECLYLVGFQPVFAFWAFESGCTPEAFAPPTQVFPKHEQVGSRHGEGAAATATPAETTARPRLRRPAMPWSPRRLAIAAGVALAAFVAIFGFSPRATVVSWLDRAETIRAREGALLRIIARDERARTGGVSEEELEAEMMSPDAAVAVVAPPETTEAEAPEEPEEIELQPLPPFDSAKGALSIDKVPGSILILHFWSAADGDACGEITSFVSMVAAETFDAVRDLGGEAYLVTREESVDEGNELLRSCGVQDPFLLGDPGGAILNDLVAGAKPPVTVIYDKLSERVLATYPRRDWLEPAALEDLQKLFLLQAF